MTHLRLRFSQYVVLLTTGLLLAACSAVPALTPVSESPPVPVSPSPILVAESAKEPSAAEVELKLVELKPVELIEENNIFFDSASTEVDADEVAKLRLHAARLKDDPEKRVLLVGHTDDLGSRNYNLALAEQRILSVRKLLRRYGVSPRQIRRYRGDGEKVPNSCKLSECRQKMRRVELVYSQK